MKTKETMTMKTMMAIIVSVATLAGFAAHETQECPQSETTPASANALLAEIQGCVSLVRRVTPGLAGKVEFFLAVRKGGESEWFDLSVDDAGGLVVEGNTVNALCAGFGWYLRHIARTQFFWEGSTAISETRIHPFDGHIRRQAPCQWRTAFNYCAHSYSLAFADRSRWERELDILALHGVNMPLAVTGLECVWYETLMELGWSDEEARAALVGPAFMAWQWMTNIESYAGPLPKSWLDSHRELGRFIIGRERELGMTPILQGFTGNIPRTAAEKFPDASIKLQRKWLGFPGSAQLDPLDPLFPKVASAFYSAQKRIFGESVFYATDPFHESAPPREGEAYLHDVGKAIGRELTAAHPGARACMQSWSIRMPILRAFGKDRIVVLDINGSKADRTNGFDGYPFVTGLIWNFGGRTSSGGDIASLASNPFARKRENYPNCIGAGLFPEGIHTSPLYFALALDLLWRDDAPPAKDWLAELLASRYAISIGDAAPLADGYLETFYNKRAQRTSSLIPTRPTLLPQRSDPNDPYRLAYDSRILVDLWKHLCELSLSRGETPGLRYDIVDVGHLVLANASYALYARILDAFAAGDANLFSQRADDFLSLAALENDLLGCEPLLSLGGHLDMAAEWATTPEERRLYLFNMKQQVTLWGPLAGPRIFDYAWKEWNGLVSDYYMPRWRMFFDACAEVLSGKREVSDLTPKKLSFNRPSYRANGFYSEMADFEEAFATSDAIPSRSDTKESASALSSRILKEKERLFEQLFKTNPLDAMHGSIEALRKKLALGAVSRRKRIGSWNLSSGYSGPLDVDVTGEISKNGRFTFFFEHKRGSGLTIKSVKLLQDDVVLFSRDKETIARKGENCPFPVEHGDFVVGAKFLLRIDVSCESGDSCGTIFIEAGSRKQNKPENNHQTGRMGDAEKE